MINKIQPLSTEQKFLFEGNMPSGHYVLILLEQLNYAKSLKDDYQKIVAT